MIALTFDTDWVDEEILKVLADRLIDLNLKATFFVTGNYKCLNHKLFEVNPHVNFNGTYDHYRTEFLKIKKFTPAALAVRNHSLYFHERLRPVLKDLKVKYSSNVFLPLVNDLKPIYIGKDLYELPIYFLDYWYLETFATKANFKLSALNLKQNGLKVFDFHPIHLALNTPGIKFYNLNKKYYKNPTKIFEKKFKGEGIANLFDSLLNYIIKNNLKTYQLKEIYFKSKIS